MKNTKITYKWTNNYDESQPDNGFLEETDYIVTDGVYGFDDYLSDHGVQFENEDDDTYFVIDEDGDRTGEAFFIISETPTDEEITDEKISKTPTDVEITDEKISETKTMSVVKEERNEQGQLTYRKLSNGYSEKWKYNDRGWEKSEYDAQGREIFYETSRGFWIRREYDDQGREIYLENSYGDKATPCPVQSENNEIAFLFDDTKIGERSQSFSDGYVIINASTKDEAVETFKAQYGRGKHNEALCAEVVSDFNRVGQIKRSNLPCHNYIDLTKPQEPNQSNTEEQTDGRK